MNQNPMFSNIHTGEAYYDEVSTASYKGICAKTFFLLAISVVVAIMTMFYLPEIIMAGNFDTFYLVLGISSIVGFISLMVGRVSESKAKYASFIYALCEGLFLGTITLLIDSLIPGASVIAVFSTLVIFTVMLTLFSTGIIRVTNRYRGIVLSLGLSAIAIVLFTSIMSLFVDFSQYIGILLLLEGFILIYGVISLALHFQEAQYIVDRGASKNAEWSVALGLIVSIIYIYIRILRLVLILASRSRD